VQGEFDHVRVHSCCAHTVRQEKAIVDAAFARPTAAYELALQLQWLLLPTAGDMSEQSHARVRVRIDLNTFLLLTVLCNHKCQLQHGCLSK
jgi:hypothetical protein